MVRRCLLRLPVLENNAGHLGQLNFCFFDCMCSSSLSSAPGLQVILFEELVDSGFVVVDLEDFVTLDIICCEVESDG
jgi:hypothetical protein